MGERLNKLKRGFLYGAAALGIMSSSGFLINKDYNPAMEEARQEYIYTHQDRDGLYDYDNEMIGNLEEILAKYENSTVEINTFLAYDVQGGIRSGPYMDIFGGSGLALDNGYILSAAHVIKSEFEEMLNKKWGGVVTSFNISYFTPIGGVYYELEPVWTGTEDDFTLLRFKEEPQFSIPSVPFVPGDASKLMEGSITYSFSALNEPYAKEGHVLNPLYGDEYGSETREYEYFYEDTAVVPGDSGGPVIAFLDGEPQVVGVTCMYWYTIDDKGKVDQILGGAILKINHIMEETSWILSRPTISNP